MKFSPISLGVSVICLTLSGQDAPKVQEPEYVNKMFLLQPDGSLKAVEQLQIQMGTKKTKETYFPVSRLQMKSFVDIPEERSPVRIAGNPVPQFVIKVASREYDPAPYLRLFKMYKEDGRRRVTITEFSSGGKGGMKETDVSNNSVIKTTYEKYGLKSFKITPQAPLESGEYCLGVKNTYDASCFGVD